MARNPMNTRESRSRSSKPAQVRTAQPKQAGNAADWRRNFERYTALALNLGRDDDAVTRENYYQHAEHYLRLMNDATQH